jgi:RNA polymerase primary sigma factor
MLLFPHDPLRPEGEGPVGERSLDGRQIDERQVGAIELARGEARADSPSGGPEALRRDQTGASTAALDTIETDADDAESELPAPVLDTEPDPSLSRDLIDVYFRQMGNADLLSREDEIALAKRIEAAQQAVLPGLCRVPMLVERIARWGQEVAEGRRPLGDLVDLSMPIESFDQGDDGRSRNGEAAPERLHLVDSPTLTPETPEASAVPDEDAVADTAASQEAGRLQAISPRLERLALLARDIGALSRRQLLALDAGRAVGKRADVRLQALMTDFAGEAAALQLRPERVSDLVADLEREREALAQTERELSRLGESRAAGRKEVPERHHALRSELSAIAHRVGLPVADLRRAAVAVGQAQRQLNGAREEMVKAHLRLVVWVAKRYRRNSSLDLLDLIQEGNMGLMHAVERFNYRRGVKVATYAVWWIRQSIARAIADQGRTIRIPVHMTETASKVLRERRKLQQKEGRNPAAAEIAARSGVPLARVEQVLSMVQEPTSLDVPIGEDGDSTLGDLIEAPDAVNPYAAVEASALQEAMAEAIAELTPREQHILRMRFGIGGTSDRTLAEIGEELGVTRERIRQIEAKAIEKLRHPRRARKLASFVES